MFWMRKKIQSKQESRFITFLTESLNIGKNWYSNLTIITKDLICLCLSDFSSMLWPYPNPYCCLLTPPGFRAVVVKWLSQFYQAPSKERKVVFPSNLQRKEKKLSSNTINVSLPHCDCLCNVSTYPSINWPLL